MIKYISIIIISMFIVGCQKTSKDVKDTVVAKIGNEEITLGQIDEESPEIKEFIDKKDKKLSDEELEQIALPRDLNLKLLITSKIQNEKAKTLKLFSNEDLNEQTEKEVQNKKDRIGLDAFKDDLKYLYGSEDEAKYKIAIKDGIISRKIAEYLTKDINVTEEEARKYFDENRSNYVGEFEDVVDDIKKLLIHDEGNKKIKNAYENWEKELNLKVYEENLKLVY